MILNAKKPNKRNMMKEKKFVCYILSNYAFESNSGIAGMSDASCCLGAVLTKKSRHWKEFSFLSAKLLLSWEGSATDSSEFVLCKADRKD